MLSSVHSGGKSECLQVKDGEQVIVEAGDQSAQDHSVNALLATYKACKPIVLLIDDKYALFPYDLAGKQVAYAVLGFFVIAHVWGKFWRTFMIYAFMCRNSRVPICKRRSRSSRSV
jgi:hypothetical protein